MRRFGVLAAEDFDKSGHETVLPDLVLTGSAKFAPSRAPPSTTSNAPPGISEGVAQQIYDFYHAGG